MEPVAAADLDAALRAALKPISLAVHDDSHLHAGHAGASAGRHFSVHIVSECFNGASRVARHRLVYDAARSLIERGIHALAIDARAPHEAAAQPNSAPPS